MIRFTLISKFTVAVTILVFCCNINTTCSAVIKYDQRQEGEVNVRADLENFVVLIIPTSSSSGLSLLDLITKALPTKKIKKKEPSKSDVASQQVIDDEKVDLEELKHFIESKSAAPYHVDISQTRSNLAKLHPEMSSADTINEEVLISPTVQLAKDVSVIKNDDNEAIDSESDIKDRFKKAIVEVPDELYVIETNGEKFEKVPIPISETAVDQASQTLVNTDLYTTSNNPQLTDLQEKQVKETNGEELILIGALEQCGPGRKRDNKGVCQFEEDI